MRIRLITWASLARAASSSNRPAGSNAPPLHTAQTVLHQPLIDASLVDYDDRWWMFASLAGVTRRCRGLVIYHSDSPLGVHLLND